MLAQGYLVTVSAHHGAHERRVRAGMLDEHEEIADRERVAGPVPQPQPAPDQIRLDRLPVLVEQVEEAVYSPCDASR